MARSKKKFVVNEKGKKTAVILPIKEYEDLLEDLGHLAIIAERRNEPTEPLEVVIQRLEEKWRHTEVEVVRSAYRDLDKLNPQVGNRIIVAIQSLALEPRPRQCT